MSVFLLFKLMAAFGGAGQAVHCLDMHACMHARSHTLLLRSSATQENCPVCGSASATIERQAASTLADLREFLEEDGQFQLKGTGLTTMVCRWGVYFS